VTGLLGRRLLYVTGKGGVGRSTVAAALGLVAAARGRRTIVCEVAEQAREGPHAGRAPAPGHEERLADGLWSTTVDPEKALEEWLATQVGSRRLVRPLAASNAFQYFVAAAPGAKELVTITKAWELAQPERWDRRADGYDLVIVDAAASGHGLGMLRTPRTFGDIARVGPIAAQSERVRTFLADPGATGYVAVALPEEMPVNETLELESALGREVGAALDAIVVNRVARAPFTAAERRAVAAARASGPDAAAALREALAAERRAAGQQRQVARLRRGTGAPVLTLPYLVRQETARARVEALAALLGPRLARIGA
jgi:anion-transporting  ArsA/GET3 family ATPase